VSACQVSTRRAGDSHRSVPAELAGEVATHRTAAGWRAAGSGGGTRSSFSEAAARSTVQPDAGPAMSTRIRVFFFLYRHIDLLIARQGHRSGSDPSPDLLARGGRMAWCRRGEMKSRSWATAGGGPSRSASWSSGMRDRRRRAGGDQTKSHDVVTASENADERGWPAAACAVAAGRGGGPGLGEEEGGPAHVRWPVLGGRPHRRTR